ANAISEARLAWIERVRSAYLDCHESDETNGQVEIKHEEWEALSNAICSPCRLRDGMEQNDG
ncbi:MAG TPA: hypothetical protein VFS68_06890, partial [Candidatus Udaeobacter sp.]|nr:hypothetical protein [Candidatus Udaeobacter sp.]